jgi:hypothetical protein
MDGDEDLHVDSDREEEGCVKSKDVVLICSFGVTMFDLPVDPVPRHFPAKTNSAV